MICPSGLIFRGTVPPMPERYQAVLNGRAYDLASSRAITRTVDRNSARIYYFDGR